MPKQQILFVINPISGNGKPTDWGDLINSHLDTTKFDYQIQYTKGQGDAIAISASATKNKVDIVCAVGGDGTINEVAQGLIHTDTSLAIIPRGSGNGLARHFSISTKPALAIKKLNTAQKHTIDAGRLNDKLFLCLAGIGFDAVVAQAFDQFGKRGLLSYLWLSFIKFISYKPNEYKISIDQQTLKTKAFLIAFANASQFGNNAYIAPQAKTDDGLLNLVIIKPFPILASINILIKVFTKKILQSKYCETYTFRSLTICSDQTRAHIDGEPIESSDQVSITVLPESLHIMY